MDTSIIPPKKTCTKCGVEKDSSDFYSDKGKRDGLTSHCKKCRISESKKWNQENAELLREQSRVRYLANKEKVAQLGRERYLKNPERAKAYSREWQRANPDKVYERNKRWQRANMPKRRLYCQQRRAREKELTVSFTESDWHICLTHFYECCAYCGKQRNFWNVLEMEHFIPITDPNCPGTVPSNIVPACRSCNSSKNKKDVRKWLAEHFGKRKAKQIERRIIEYLNSRPKNR